MPKPAAMTPAEIEALIAAIARQDLGVETLATRDSDGLDFHEVAVWSLREALMKAFHAGRDRGPVIAGQRSRGRS